MSSRVLLSSAAILVAACGLFLLGQEWVYLGRGYSLRVSLGGDPGQLYEVVFPVWRRLFMLLVATLFIAASGMLTARRKMAVPFLLLTLLAILGIGVVDVYEYGFIGSPTSWKSLTVVALAAGAAVHAKRLGLLQ